MLEMEEAHYSNDTSENEIHMPVSPLRQLPFTSPVHSNGLVNDEEVSSAAATRKHTIPPRDLRPRHGTNDGRFVNRAPFQEIRALPVCTICVR